MLRRCRTEAGLTQRQLADRAGTSAPAICAYERGERVPRADTLVRIVAATGATLRWEVTPAGSIDVQRNARVLEEVLDLADHLPRRRPADAITAPVFAELAS